MSSTKDSPRPSPRPRPIRSRPSPRPRDDETTPAVDEHTTATDEHATAADEHATAADEGTIAADEHETATEEHTTADSDTATEVASLPRRFRRLRRRNRRATLLGALLGCFVLLAAATVWFAIEVDGLRSGAPEDNAALVDSDTTTAVTKDVSDGLKSVFSYNYTNLERTKRAAGRALLGDARKQYNHRFAKVADTAKQDKLMRTASVRHIGVRSIDGDTAKLLVFLDQQTLTDKDEQSGQQAISLDVVAKLVDGTWKIARFDDG